jgi:hypothetical protein
MVHSKAPAADDNGVARSKDTTVGGAAEEHGTVGRRILHSRLLDLHEEYVRSRRILQLMRFRPVVRDAIFGEDSASTGVQQSLDLKAAIVDRDRLVRDLCKTVATQRELEVQVCARRKLAHLALSPISPDVVVNPPPPAPPSHASVQPPNFP